MSSSSPARSRRDAQLFDSNRFMLLAMLRRMGCAVSDLGIRRDDSADIAQVLWTPLARTICS